MDHWSFFLHLYLFPAATRAAAIVSPIFPGLHVPWSHVWYLMQEGVGKKQHMAGYGRPCCLHKNPPPVRLLATHGKNDASCGRDSDTCVLISWWSCQIRRPLWSDDISSDRGRQNFFLLKSRKNPDVGPEERKGRLEEGAPQWDIFLVVIRASPFETWEQLMSRHLWSTLSHLCPWESRALNPWNHIWTKTPSEKWMNGIGYGLVGFLVGWSTEQLTLL